MNTTKKTGKGRTSAARRRRARRRVIRRRVSFLGLLLLTAMALNFIVCHISDAFDVVASVYYDNLGVTECLAEKVSGLDFCRQTNAEELKVEGVPESLAELYDRNPEARQFVLGYNDYNGNPENISISEDLDNGTVPMLLQWDERWGYETYGDDYIAVNGCGPTCLTMVYAGLTGEDRWNPYSLAQYADDQGYYVEGTGSSWNLMTDFASQIGLCSEELSADENVIAERLRSGNPIICSMGPGDFTTQGHFIVLTDINANGMVSVNDPNSIERSEKQWDLSELLYQVRNLWAYSIYR